ncbi:alpha/beta fold hydrolase, partial [archaeon]
LRNHGRSAHVDGIMTLPMLADDVAHTLAAHDVVHPILVGHSLGGKVACLLALRHPAVVSRLVIMDIAPMAYDAHRPDWDAVRNVVDAAAELDVSRFSRRPDVDAALARRVPDAGMRSFVAQNLVLAAGGGSYRWRINLPSIAQSMPHFAAFPQLYDAHDAATHAHYPPNHCPVDFIAGERSTFCPASAMVQARAYFPEARHHVLQGAGHWLHADKPAEFLHLLRSILGASK